MTKGINNTSKLLQSSIGEVCKAFININKVDADMFLLMNLFASIEKAPINLNLVFTLSNSNVQTEFGNGVKVNYNRVIERTHSSSGVEMFKTYNPDGSIDEFYRDNTFYYPTFRCNRTLELIKDTYEGGDTATNTPQCTKIIDSSQTEYIYPRVSHNVTEPYPYKIKYATGNYLDFSFYDNGKLNLIKSNKNEMIHFAYSDMVYIYIYRYDQLIETITLSKSSGIAYLKYLEYKNNNNKVLNKLSFSYFSGNQTILNKIIVSDARSNTYVSFGIDDGIRVTSINSKKSALMNQGVTTSITYNDNYYTNISTYKNKELRICFNEHQLPVYEIDNEGYVVTYEYQKENNAIKLKNKISHQNCSPNFESTYNIIKNGYFKNSLNNWSTSGAGLYTITQEPPLTQNVVFGDNVVSINNQNNSNSTSLKQVINYTGLSYDTFTFGLWVNQEYVPTSDLHYYAFGQLEFKDNYNTVHTEIIPFFKDNETTLWEYKYANIKVNKSFNKIIISIVFEGGTKYKIDSVSLYRKQLNSISQFSDIGQAINNISDNAQRGINYDDINRIQNIYTENQSISYAYDDKGNIRGTLDKYNTLTVNSYDQNDNIKKVVISNNGKTIETNCETIVNSNTIVKNVSDEKDNPKTYTFDKVLKTIKESIDRFETKTTFNYDSWNNLSNYIVSNSIRGLSDSVDFTYIGDNTSQFEYIDTINLENGCKYTFNYDSANRLTSVLVGDSSAALNYVKYTYEDDIYDGGTILTNKLSTKQLGTNGDKFSFTYDNRDRIILVKLHKKDSTEVIDLFSYEYDDFDRLIKYNDLRNNVGLNYFYNESNQITKVVDKKNSNNYLSYIYDDTGNITIKKVKWNNDIILQSFDTIGLKKMTPNLFFSAYKGQDSFFKSTKSCFFNEIVYNNNQITQSVFATSLYKDKKNKKVLIPYSGLDIVPTYDGSVPCIEYNELSTKKLTYKENSFWNNGNPSLTVMLWFKPTKKNINKTVLTIGDYIDTGLRVQITMDSKIHLTGLGSYDYTDTLLLNNEVKLYKWNFLCLRIHNYYSGSSTLNSDYEITLNSEKKILKTSGSQRINKELTPECLISIGNDFNSNTDKFVGKLAGVVISTRSLEENNIINYRNLFKEYVIDYTPPYEDGIVETCGVNQYDDSILDLFKFIPLNTSLESIDSVKPIKFSKKQLQSANKDIVFHYDKFLKRHVYSTAENHVVYDLGIGSSGTLAAKVYFNKHIPYGYIFDNKDTTGKKLSLYYHSGYLQLNIDGKVINTNISISLNSWHFIYISWTYIYYDQERGHVHSFTVGCNSKLYTKALDLSFKYDDFITSIGRKVNGSIDDGTNYMDGYIEALGYKNYGTGSSYMVEYRDKVNHIVSCSKKIDSFGLIKEKNINTGHNNILTHEYTYYNFPNTNRIAPLITKEKITSRETLEIEYFIDEVLEDNNITRIRDNENDRRGYGYTHDGKLSSETLFDRNEYRSYTYSKNGNIKTINKGFFGNSNPTTFNFEYEHFSDGTANINLDRLAKFGEAGNEKDIKYEDRFPGNPTFYGKNGIGISYTWEGRRLVQYYDNLNDIKINYLYNDQGLRIKKEIIKPGNTEVINYIYERNNLIYEKSSNKKMKYLYDETGLLYGIIYNGVPYYYIRDILGNILGLVDIDGYNVVKYEYDAFGNVLDITGLLANSLGKANSFLYKGYYYDFETGLYLLTTRYYDPKIGRFISADDVSYLDPESIGGLNLYAYCENNRAPVRCI